ncbi:hypothetical protein N1851_024478 [Merluccius polli]|uniref:Tyr recombinase domain-containing protein n=1 Tax=Merluccius polli TaxID=89951 RepID=A0AA47MF62_MERPO|nr:hypothetical protein N1851_024478 [Merluccius polli]
MQKKPMQQAPRRARRLSRHSRLTRSIAAPGIWGEDSEERQSISRRGEKEEVIQRKLHPNGGWAGTWEVYVGVLEYTRRCFQHMDVHHACVQVEKFVSTKSNLTWVTYALRCGAQKAPGVCAPDCTYRPHSPVFPSAELLTENQPWIGAQAMLGLGWPTWRACCPPSRSLHGWLALPNASPQPPRGAYSAQEDVLSTRASEGLFLDQACGDGGGGASHSSHTISLEGERSTLAGSEASQMSVRPALKVALARLGLDAAPSVATPPSAFFRGASRAGEFCVPPSAPFLEELQSCWADPRRLTRPSQSARALASMSAASSYGLDRMPDIEPSVAALVLSPGEALRPDARCPRPQCRLTDDHIVRGYNTAARMGRIGNSMSHLILALSQTLQASDVDPSVRDLSDASLQAFGFMTRELGRLMSSLTLARRQIWLAQSPLLEPYRRALRTLPVVPGELFGPAAQQALERSLQVTQAREQFSSLRRGQPGRLRPPAAAAVPLAVPRPFSRPPSRLDAGLAASTIKVYVAAISAQHNRVDGVTVGSHTLVTRFLKGAQRLRPPLRNPVPRWDLPLVLGALSRPPFEPLQDLGLDVLSMKTAFLLAIASARRVSELHALSVHGECLIWHPRDTGVTLRPNPSFLSKTFSTAFVNQPLTLAAFSPSSQEMGPGQDGAPLCPVRALRRYLQLTAGIRRSDSLFVCHTGPRRGHALSKQRLSRWIVGAIELSYSSGGVPVPPHVRSHSTRGVAASWGALRGVPLSDICAAASWSSPCTFARFYSFNVVPHHPVAWN